VRFVRLPLLTCGQAKGLSVTLLGVLAGLFVPSLVRRASPAG
jgi:hypothetical protein